jgi:hypothetical protein
LRVFKQRSLFGKLPSRNASPHLGKAAIALQFRMFDTALFTRPSLEMPISGEWSSNRSGRDEIWIADSDGKNPFQLTDFVGEMTGTAHWSPDNWHIAFDASVAGSPGDLFVVDIEEKKPKHLTTKST